MILCKSNKMIFIKGWPRFACRPGLTPQPHRPPEPGAEQPSRVALQSTATGKPLEGSVFIQEKKKKPERLHTVINYFLTIINHLKLFLENSKCSILNSNLKRHCFYSYLCAQTSVWIYKVKKINQSTEVDIPIPFHSILWLPFLEVFLQVLRNLIL